MYIFEERSKIITISFIIKLWYIIGMRYKTFLIVTKT